MANTRSSRRQSGDTHAFRTRSAAQLLTDSLPIPASRLEPVVNIAARLADYARPSEVLVTKAVVDSISDEEFTFTRIGPVTLKGVAQPVEVLAAYPLA